jgi:hypothetical protein
MLSFGAAVLDLVEITSHVYSTYSRCAQGCSGCCLLAHFSMLPYHYRMWISFFCFYVAGQDGANVRIGRNCASSHADEQYRSTA